MIDALSTYGALSRAPHDSEYYFSCLVSLTVFLYLLVTKLSSQLSNGPVLPSAEGY